MARGVPRVEKTCPVCEKSWLVKAGYIAQYPNATCSMACRDARNRVQITCAVCGDPMTMKASRVAANKTGITCSDPCFRVLRARNTSRARAMDGPTEATCSVCGEAFARKASQLAKYETNYCGRACSTAGKTGVPNIKIRTGEWLSCETCGNAVRRTPATLRGHVFCSRECAGRPGQPRGERKERVVKECAGDDCDEVLVLLPGDVDRYRFCSRSCSRRGDRNPAYRDGASRTQYAPGFTKKLKDQIAERDGHMCCRCSAPREGGGQFVVHHIDGRKTDHRTVNLVFLCQPCHMIVHWQMVRNGE